MDDSLIVSSGALLVCFSDPRPQAVPCEPGTKTWEPTAGRFLSRGRRCDIIGRSHKARHLSTWCIHPTGPLLFTPHTRIKVPVDSRISDNSQRRTTQQPDEQLWCTRGVSGAGRWYHPILIPEIQGHISIVCKAKHAQALFGKREKNRGWCSRCILPSKTCAVCKKLFAGLCLT